jgi:Domain of unknown function (DUF1707)
MEGPGDEIAVAAADRGRLRASHADRERVIGTLKTAFVQGRLTQEEFDARVGQVYASRTYAELAEVTTDLPARPARTQRPRDPWRATKVAGRTVYAVILPGIFWLICVPGHTTVGAAVTMAVIIYLVFWMVGASMMICSRQQKRSAAQLPPRSAPGTGG